MRNNLTTRIERLEAEFDGRGTDFDKLLSAIHGVINAKSPAEKQRAENHLKKIDVDGLVPLVARRVELTKIQSAKNEKLMRLAGWTVPAKAVRGSE